MKHCSGVFASEIWFCMSELKQSLKYTLDRNHGEGEVSSSSLAGPNLGLLGLGSSEQVLKSERLA